MALPVHAGPGLPAARFRDLRAAGAFLVSAAWDGKQVSGVTLLSEKGATARLVNPWPKAGIRVTRLRDGQAIEVRAEGGIAVFTTQAGERYAVQPRDSSSSR